MPVRFRCHYCNQLLGISRRKIGMDVSCPTCHNKLTVPPTDSPDVDQPAEKKAPLFEGSELDALLKQAAPPPEPAKAVPLAPLPWAVPSPAPPPAAPGNFHVEPLRPPVVGPPAGVMLSPTAATLLTVGAVLVLAAAFAAGLLIGRFLL